MLTSAFAESNPSRTSTDSILSDIATTSAINQLLTHTGPSVSPNSQVLISTVHGPVPGYGSGLARKIFTDHIQEDSSACGGCFGLK